MPAALDRLQFAPPPPPGMLRALGVALVAHVLLVLALGWGVNWKSEPVLVSAQAELWSALPQEAAPQAVEPPPPPPTPVAVPVPPPPVVQAEPPRPDPAARDAEIAIERAKERKAQEKREQLALEREKKREADKRERLEADKRKQLEARREREEKDKKAALAKAAEDKKKQETARREKAEEAQLAAQREANLARIKGLAGATGGATATGSALRASGPSASYAGRIVARVRPNIVFGEDVEGNPRTEVEVRTAPDGTIIGQRIVKSSGVKGWDDAVLKALIKTETLPRDTDGRVPPSLIIEFRPKN